ncbi:MAG: hypothetical protein AAGJ86_04330 [Pseudomonadota bacterium]
MNRNVSIILIVVALIGLATLFIGDANDGAEVPTAGKPVTSESSTSVAVSPALSSSALSEPAADASTLVDPAIEKDCKHPFDVFRSEDLERERERVQAMSVFGEGGHIDSLTQLAMRDVQSFAEQGDSAAMAVLAKMYFLQSGGVAPERVYEYMTLAGSRTNKADFTIMSSKKTRSPEQKEMLELARDWAWRSALHGRYFALQIVAEVEIAMGETVATKGWVTQSFFDTLDRRERSDRYSLNYIYPAAIPLIDPEAATGAQELLLSIIPQPSEAREFAPMIAEEFERRRIELGLTKPNIGASRLPDIEAALLSICEEYEYLLQ